MKKAVGIVVLIALGFGMGGLSRPCAAQEVSGIGCKLQASEPPLSRPALHPGDWVNRFSLPAQSNPVATVTDSMGNFYITGGSAGPNGTIDFTTLKVDSNGKLLWVSQYNGPGKGTDWPVALVVDGDGSVIVAGNVQQAKPPYPGTQAYDLATVKYDSEGTQLWARVYKRSGYDTMRVLGVDGGGNVYVGGAGSAKQGNLILKYGPNGKELWEKHLTDGNGPGLDAMRVESDGSFTLVGAVRIGSMLHVAIFKYDPDGNLLSEKLDVQSSIADIAFDGSGNIYIGSVFNGYGVIKYDRDGRKVWERFVNSYCAGDGKIAVDAAGNVYFAGTTFKSSRGYQYQSLMAAKFDANGTPLWENRCDGSAVRDYRAKTIRVDAQGNAYLVGWSSTSATYTDFFTLSYDAAGNFRWSKLFNGRKSLWDIPVTAVVDGMGNLLVTGTSGSGYYPYPSDGTVAVETLKYSGEGTLLWARQFAGSSYTDNLPAALSVNAQGTLFVAGTSYFPTGISTYFLLSYDARGNCLRAQRGASDSTNKSYTAEALAIDDSASAWVTGTATSTGLDILTQKFASPGTAGWSTTCYGPGKGDDASHGIALDPEGNAIVVGETLGLNGRFTFVTLKYGPRGKELWRRYYEATGGDSKARAVAVDRSGNIYVTGESIGSNGKRDIVTLKYSASGTRRWVRRFDGQARGEDVVQAMGLDSAGNVLIAGASQGSAGDFDFITLKYTPKGLLLWNKRYDGTRGDDRAEALAVDSSDHVVVTGESMGPDGSFDYATIKYDASGNRSWVQTYAGEAKGDDRPGGVAVDGSGNVVVAGGSIGSRGDYDFLTLKYTPDGTLSWEERYDGTFGDDRARGVAVDRSGNVFVAGESMGCNGRYQAVTLKYVPR